MQITSNDILILRTLAHQYMEIASLPVQRQKMELWKAFNRHDNTRPMVTIDQLPWHELNYDHSLTCVVQDPFFRAIEDKIRKTIFQWKHFPADMVVEPFLTIPFCASSSGYGLTTVCEEAFTHKDNDVISHNYINQLEEEEDLDKIQDMQITLNKEKSREWLEAAKVVFEDIIPVRQAGGVTIKLQIWDVLSEFMNVQNIYFDLIDRPEFIHSIMERMTHSTLSGIQQANELGLFDTSLNLCHCSGIYTDELLPDFGAGTGNDSYHSWSFAMAQLFSSASPATTAEFEIHYAKQLAKHFGMLYYGCCERLDDRLDIVQEIPNIRKISCSPWSNKHNFAANLKKDIIMSNKPSPSFLATRSFDLDLIKKDLMETCSISKEHDVKVEFLLKDISTVQNQPNRLVEWANAAMQIVEHY